MRCIYWRTKASRRGDASDRVLPGRAAALALALAGATAGVGAAQPPTVPCEVVDVGYAEAAALATLTVKMACGGSGSPLPVDSELLAGLTAYGDSFGEDEVVAELPAHPDGVERRIIEDPNTKLYDFREQALRVAADSRDVTLVFEAPAEAVADKPFMLFALWKAEAKESCDAGSRYERQGCKDYGYVIGYDLEDALIMAYPGLIWAMTDPGGGMAPYEVRRWVVERYR